MRTITEGSIVLKVPDADKVSSAMDVFYNPVMKLNRDITVLVLNAAMHAGFIKEGSEALDLLAGTGAKGLRILKECKPICCVTLNDMNSKAAKLIKRNAAANKLKKGVKITNKPANVLLQEQEYYDFIDLDPFGTPVPFLDDVIKRIKPHGLLGVTATDTSSLCGSYPKKCLRRYGSVPLRCPQMHEIGLRILIRKVQEIAAQYDVALIPIFSHSSDHYMRVFFRKETGGCKTDAVVEKHRIIYHCGRCNVILSDDKCKFCASTDKIRYAGPLWIGELWDLNLVKEMISILNLRAELDNWANFKELTITPAHKEFKTMILDANSYKLVRRIYREAQVGGLGFFDLHAMGFKQVPKMVDVRLALRKKGFKVARTHFRLTGLRSSASYEELTKLAKRSLQS